MGGGSGFFEKVKGGKKLREVTKWSFLGNVERYRRMTGRRWIKRKKQHQTDLFPVKE